MSALPSEVRISMWLETVEKRALARGLKTERQHDASLMCGNWLAIRVTDDVRLSIFDSRSCITTLQTYDKPETLLDGLVAANALHAELMEGRS